MQNEPLHLPILFSEWLIALLVLALTLLVTTATRAFLKRIHTRRDWRILRQIAPSISNILYIVGLRLFLDVAPLSGKVGIWLDHFAYILTVTIFLSLALKTALLTLEWSFIKRNSSETLRRGFIPLLRNLITLFVFFTGGIMVLTHFDYDVMSLITAFGVSSLAVGLAAKDTLSNMISGFILIIDRNLKPGDRINLNGTIGDVKEIGLRSTQILVMDGNTLIVPNSDLVNTKILNLSMPSRQIKCTVTLRVSCETSFKLVKSLCFSTLEEMDRVSQGRPKLVNLISLSEGLQHIQIGFWIYDFADSNLIISEFHEKLLSSFDHQGIKLMAPPYSPLFTPEKAQAPEK